MREDIVIKYMYATAYFKKSSDLYWYENIYRKHIGLLTGGIEDNKRSIDAFVEQFNNLLHSLQKYGYDPNKSIPVNSYGEILNGAHRFAACKALRITPKTHTDDSVRGITWKIPRQESIFTEEEKIACLQGYNDLFPESELLVVWPTLLSGFTNPHRSALGTHIDIAGWSHLSFSSKRTFQDCIYDIYAFDGYFAGNIGIQKKINTLASFGHTCTLVLSASPIHKEQLRQQLYDALPTQIDEDIRLFCSFHSAGSKEELRYLTDMFLSPQSIQHLLKRTYTGKGKQIFESLRTIKKELGTKDFLVVGSGPMMVMGLEPEQDDHDIDIITHQESNTGVLPLSENIDHITGRYHKAGRTNAELIENNSSHFLWRGYKFLSLDILLTQKLRGTREKDLIHAQQIIASRKIGESGAGALPWSYHLQTAITRKKIQLLHITRHLTKKLGIYKYVSFLRVRYILNKHIQQQHIAFISPNFDPYPLAGGVVEQTKLLSASFQEKGYKTSIYTYRHDRSRPKEELTSQGYIYRYDSSSELFWMILSHGYRYDGWISQTIFRHTAILAILRSLRLVRGTTILCLHSGGEQDEIHRVAQKLGSRRSQKLYFYFISYFDYINCLTSDNKTHLQTYLPDSYKQSQILSIANGYPYSVRKNKDRLAGKVQLLYIGKIHQEKGVFDVLQACTDIEGIDLHIAGTGSAGDISRVQAYTEHHAHIHYHGYVDSAEKESLFDAMDILILPSYHEGFPMVLLEAVQYNLSIISTDVGEVKHIFGDSIEYITAGDQESIILGIQKSTSNRGSPDYSTIRKNTHINKISSAYLEALIS